MTQIQLLRFFAKVHKEQRGCWRWIGARGSRTAEYGVLTIEGRRRYAHRAAYEHFVGPIPQGLEIDHLCRNPRCVNPDHMQPVSHLENCRRGRVGKHNAAKTHCPHGHPYSGSNLKLRTSRGSLERVCLACNNRRPKPRYRITKSG